LADVNTYLVQILSATYGEEVRSAIHDSINAMNIESSNAMQYARTAQDSAAASATAAGESATTALGAKADALLAAGAAGESATTALGAKADALLAAGAAGESATTALGAKADALLAAENAIAAENSVDAKVADVMTMKSNLMLNHAIYQELYDSNLNILLDSAGGSILGEVIFSDVEDVTRLHKRIDDLETIINQMASLLINNRLVVVETSMTEANESITRINEHALFDSTFI
jgi:hypothetical protein